MSRIPGITKYSDMELSKPSDIVNAFGDYFNSVLIDLASVLQLSEKTTHSSSHIMAVCIKIEDARATLKHFKNLFTMRIDGFPCFILQDCAEVLAQLLYVIFNLVFKHCVFPSQWKNAYISPILKTGRPNEITNYRGISLLCNFAKALETIAYL